MDILEELKIILDRANTNNYWIRYTPPISIKELIQAMIGIIIGVSLVPTLADMIDLNHQWNWDYDSETRKLWYKRYRLIRLLKRIERSKLQ